MNETVTGRETVMLLGAGERSRELALAFRRLGADVETVEVQPDGGPEALAAL
ncbi:phosphoribosylglycinamide formyltransferase 2, partial [Mycobacterium sp. ITM-2017-0098]